MPRRKDQIEYWNKNMDKNKSGTSIIMVDYGEGHIRQKLYRDIDGDLYYISKKNNREFYVCDNLEDEMRLNSQHFKEEESDEDTWNGYKFKNGYYDSITNCDKDLDKICIEYKGYDKIYLVDGCAKKTYNTYTLNITNDMTYREVFKQLDEQSKNVFKGDHRFIEEIHRVETDKYHIFLGS